MNLTQLEEDFPDHRYLRKESIPCYPECVFRAPKVCHVTNQSGLEGILEDGGFQGKDSFLWWNLSVSDGTAVKHQNFSQRWQRLDQVPSLKEFTTSPAFQSKSRYGNFCFTFNLRALLNIYSKEYCDRTAPILRVLGTRFFKQEILYEILVHPRYMTCYSKYPRLPFNDKRLCGYRFGNLSWRCQSPSDNYKYCLGENDEGDMVAIPLRESEYFVWDNVAVAFHMEQNWLLPVSHSRLFKNLSVCEIASPNLSKGPKMSLSEAKEEVEKLRNKYLS